MKGEPLPEPPTVSGVLRAARRLAGHLRRTPLERAPSLRRGRAEVHLKLENLQRTGSFKARGALNAVAALDRDVAARGVVTASAGNHGLGVALAASLRGLRSTVFLPEGAPAAKRDRIARMGAEVRLVAGSYDAAHAAAIEHAARTGEPYIHAFSEPAVVEGQGTVGLEIFEELPEVGTILVPVGGGGLVGGIGLVARALGSRVRVIGVQSAATAAMHASLAAGALRSPPMAASICDGLAGDVDERSLTLASAVVDEVLVVEEAEVRRAVRRLQVEEGLVAEGSGAVAVAALHADLVRFGAAPTVAVVTGGNIDADLLSALLREDGR